MFNRRDIAMTGAVLTVALVLAGAPAHAAEPAVEVEKYLPDDTSLVFSVDFETLYDSELGKKFALRFLTSLLDFDFYGKMLDDAPFASYQKTQTQKIPNVLRSLDFNPARDMTSITFVGTRADPGRTLNSPTFVLVHGKFDPVKFHNTYDDLVKERTEFMKIHKAGERKIYEFNWTLVGNRSWFGTLVDKSTFVMALSKGHVLDVLDKADGQKKSLMKRELREALKKASPGRFVSFTAMAERLRPLVPEGTEGEKVKKTLQKLRMADAGIIATDELRFELTLVCDEADAAKAFDTLLRDGLATAKLALTLEDKEKAPEVLLAAKFLEAATIATQDKTVTLKSSVPKEAIDDSFKKVMRRIKDAKKPKN